MSCSKVEIRNKQKLNSYISLKKRKRKKKKDKLQIEVVIVPARSLRPSKSFLNNSGTRQNFLDELAQALAEITPVEEDNSNTKKRLEE